MKEQFVSKALGTDDELPRCLEDKVCAGLPIKRATARLENWLLTVLFYIGTRLEDCDCTKSQQHLLVEKGLKR